MAVKHWQLGLIGYPLGHSLSPQLHHAALDALGLKGSYALFPVEQTEHTSVHLESLLSKLRNGELDGLNVTIPYKQTVLFLVDALTPEAHKTGAVNTLLMRNSQLIGANTDVQGFQDDLFSRWSFSEQDRTCLLLGAGGAGRAVAAALADKGWQILIAARRQEQTIQMISDLQAHYRDNPFRVIDWSDAGFQDAVWSASLLVNATPLGMPPWQDETPLPESISFPENLRVYDLVYQPQQTKLIQLAQHKGNEACNGLGMLVGQAAAAFHLWTGQQPPIPAMWQAVTKVDPSMDFEKNMEKKPKED